MGRIARLPEVLANQIAAGEVVERPVSVVRELVENALDAGACSVFVELEDGGRALIRVVDDGCGMDRDDAILAIERHATSKLRTPEDLHRIETLGFRGEALPSIASVCRFRLVTRTASDDLGTEVRIDGGGAPEIRDAGGRVGTRVEVGELFHNVPARLKFLKRTATELGHIKTLLTGYALGYPHIHFRLSHNGRVTIDHPVAPNLKQRIFQVLGKAVTDRLYEARLDGPVQVRGYIAEPTSNRPNMDGIFTFINGRRVRDKVVNHALMSAYGNLLDRGRYPYAVLYLHLPADLVDVNVHPTKAEVRFVQSGEVHGAISRACRITLSAAPWAGGPEGGGAEVYRGTEEGGGSGLMRVGEAEPYRGERPGGGRAYWPSDGPLPPRPQELDFSGDGAGHPAGAAGPQTYGPAPGEEGAAPGARFTRMRIIGQARRSFIVCEDEQGLHFIDQHAAHERIAYERIRTGYRAADLPRQQLLFPVQLELGAAEANAAGEHSETIARLGIGLEPFGGATWQITAVPSLLASASPAELVRDLVAELADEGHADLIESRTDLLFATMACHSVVRAGDELSFEEMKALLGSMDGVAFNASCPHGRPVVTTLFFDELEKRFHRR